jgi:uncharacterized protein with GYD domain
MQRDLVLGQERQHAVVQEIGCRDRRLSVYDLANATLQYVSINVCRYVPADVLQWGAFEPCPRQCRRVIHLRVRGDYEQPINEEEAAVPKFMIKASYTTEGALGLLKEGGTGRRAAVQKLIESIGGKVEAFYFAYGEDDAYVIIDVPDAISGLALSLAVNASGAVRLSTIPLITAEEIDAACKKSVPYRAPGA